MSVIVQNVLYTAVVDRCRCPSRQRRQRAWLV